MAGSKTKYNTLLMNNNNKPSREYIKPP